MVNFMYPAADGRLKTLNSKVMDILYHSTAIRRLTHYQRALTAALRFSVQNFMKSAATLRCATADHATAVA